MNKVFLHMLTVFLIQSFCWSQTSTKLGIGKKEIKTIELKNTHEYTIDLKKGQYALVNLKQKGIDVKVVTYDPDGKELEEFDSLNGSNGDELILLDGVQDGGYRFEVIPLGEIKRKREGTYQIEVIAISDEIETHLNEVVANLNLRNYLPGFAVSIVDKNEVLYKNAKGYANMEHKVKYTIETVQKIASISKTFIGISLMLLVEEGKFTLDTPINDLLPFKITNPYYSIKPITIRHLATHTSTINDLAIYEEKSVVLMEKLSYKLNEYPKEMQKVLENSLKNEDLPLTEFLTRILTKDGAWYRKKNFFKVPPGQDWFYSNTGAALAAYIIESVSGISYDKFVETRIWEPLDLKSASWGDMEVDTAKLSSNYTLENIRLPRYKTITYPDGEIYINSDDLSAYLIALIKGYSGENGLITSKSFQEIMKVQHEQKEGDYQGRKDGIFWEYSKTGIMGHSGGDYGVTAFMYLDPKTKLGYTFACNTLVSESTGANVEFGKIWSTLKRYATFFKSN